MHRQENMIDPDSLVFHMRDEDFEPVSKQYGYAVEAGQDDGKACIVVSSEKNNSQDLWACWVRMAPHSNRGKHRHPHTAEYYLVINGACTLYVAGKEIPATRGTAVYVPKNVVHAIRNDNDEICELIVGKALPSSNLHGLVEVD